MEKEIAYSNMQGHRDRSSWAYIVGPGDEIIMFNEKTVPGKIVIVGRDYEKRGKWSHSTYRLMLAPGVRFISGHMGWETGSITEGLGDATGHRPCDRWIDVANALGVSLPVAQEFFRMHYPKISEKLDNIEADLASIDKSTSVGVKTIALTYGNPTRRMREEGYWSWPVRILDNKNNEIGRISSDGTPSGNIKLLKRTESSGHGGGYVSLMIATPDNCRAEHGPAPHVVEETEEDRVKILSREQGNAMIKKLRL